MKWSYAIAALLALGCAASTFARQTDSKAPPAPPMDKVPSELPPARTPAPLDNPPVPKSLPPGDFQFEHDDASSMSQACGTCGTCGPCCIPQGYAPPLSYYATVDALFWSRSVGGAPLLLDQANQTLIDARNTLRFNVNTMPSLKIGKIIDEYVSIEAGFFGFYGWDANGRTVLDAVTAPLAAAPFPNLGVVFNPGDSQNFHYASSLTSFELNVREKFTDCFTALYGFRYLNLNENFVGTYIDQFGGFFGDYSTQTHNNLFGGQVGGEYTRCVSSNVNVTLHGNVGLYGNSADTRTAGSFLNPPFFAPDERQAFHAQVAFTSQLGGRASIQLTERLAARIGYQVMWLQGVALAPNQSVESDWIFLNGPAGISTRGQVFMRGALTGLEYVW